MRVVINVTPLDAPLTGVGRYTLSLAWALLSAGGAEYTYYAHGRYRSQLISAPTDQPAVSVNRETAAGRARRLLSRVPLVGGPLRRIYTFLRTAGERSRLPAPFDIYFEPNFVLEHLAAKRAVTTVHDLTFVYHPEWMSREAETYFRENFFPRIGRADLIITPSASVAAEVAEHPRLRQMRVVPIYNGIDHCLFHPGDGKKADGAPYILFVGTIEPRKNILCLLRAYRLLSPRLRRNFRLMLTGQRGWKNGAVTKELEAIGEAVAYTGYVDDQALVELYRGASVVVCPSFYEGFSFPPVEAMACGAPVVVSDIAVHRETCGDAAIYFNPLDPAELAARITKILEDGTLAVTLVERGLQRARTFTWERAASDLLRLFTKLNCET